MSLINDALKKAQRERSGGAHHPLPPAAASPTGAPPNTHPATRPATNLWPIAIAAVALVGGGAAVWVLKPSAPAPVAAAANVQPVAPSVTETPTRVEPAPAAVAAVAAIPTQLPPPAAEQPAPQLHINLPGLAPAAAPAPVAASAVQPAPTPAAPAIAAPPPVATASTPAAPAPFQVTLQLEDPRILAFLDNARISGIRIAADDAKLLMNSKVFRTGDVVDRELGLKIVTIRPAELVFEDKRGIQYRKLL